MSEAAKIIIEYADGSGSSEDRFFHVGRTCLEIKESLEHLGKGELRQGPFTMTNNETVSAGTYTYLIAGTEAEKDLEALVKKIVATEIQERRSPRLTPEQAEKVQKGMFLLLGEGSDKGATLTKANLHMHDSGSGVAGEPSQGNATKYTPNQFVGAGFFFARPGLGVTPRHQLTPDQIAGSSKVRVLVPSYGVELELKVVEVHKDIDFAYLECTTRPENGAGTDVISSEIETSPTAGASVVMFSPSLGQWLQFPRDTHFNLQIVQRSARITMLAMPLRFTYDTTTFKGDCGSPIIMSKGGKLVGMHVEMVNEMPEPGAKKRKSLASSIASSGPHEAVAMLAISFPKVPPAP